MRSFLVASAVVVAAAWGVVHQVAEGEAQAEPRAVRTQEIESVSLDGHNLPAGALRDVLTTHAGDPVDDAKLAHDRAAMLQVLAARGYLRAAVAPAQVTYADGGAFVTFAIDPGSEFHLRSVNIAGAAAKDTGVVTLTAGDVVSPTRIEEARQTLATRLAARGKPATVTVETTTDDAANAVDVTLIASR